MATRTRAVEGASAAFYYINFINEYLVLIWIISKITHGSGELLNVVQNIDGLLQIAFLLYNNINIAVHK
jgi:hypothetical protein